MCNRECFTQKNTRNNETQKSYKQTNRKKKLKQKSRWHFGARFETDQLFMLDQLVSKLQQFFSFVSFVQKMNNRVWDRKVKTQQNRDLYRRNKTKTCSTKKEEKQNHWHKQNALNRKIQREKWIQTGPNRKTTKNKFWTKKKNKKICLNTNNQMRSEKLGNCSSFSFT